MKIEEYTAYWCKTKELSKEFLQECEQQGITWFNGDRATKETMYNDCKEETCYIIKEGFALGFIVYCCREYFEIFNYKIVEYKGKQKLSVAVQNNKLKFNDYSELSLYIDEHYNEVEDIISYDNFSITKIGEQYFYMEESIEGDAEEFYEVEVIAELKYSIENDLNNEATGASLAAMFECDCCGEYVTEDCIKYLWFKIAK
ncbi:MAG: hypothetical protein RR054_04450 [Clostridia bacterium]